MRTRLLSSLASTAVVVAALAGAAPASATVFEGEVDAFRASGTPDSRAMTKLAFTYDDATGAFTGKGTFRADPSTGPQAALRVVLGLVDGTRCVAKVSAAAELTPGGTAATFTVGSPNTNLGGTFAFDGATATIANTHETIRAGQPYDCGYGSVLTSASAPLLSDTDGYADLTARPEPQPPAPPAPAPAPAPAATPAPTTPAPTTPVAPAPKAAKLSIGVTGVPEIVVKDKWVTAKITVTNAGTRTAKDVRLKVLKRKGVTLTKSSYKLTGSLKAGKSKSAKVKIKLAKNGPEDVTVRLRASGKGKLSTEGTVGLITKDGKPAFGTPGALKGRYFWANRYRIDYAWENHAVYFSTDGFAYLDFNENGGLPVDCKGPVQKIDKDGKPVEDEGCFPYTYDKASGALTVGPWTGSWKDGKLTLDELNFSELLIPAPGARYTADLEHRGFSGMCGLIFGCSTWHYQLALNPDGLFVKTRSSLTTVGDGFSTPFVAAGNYPPDQYGTYVVLENGLMQLTFANGTIERYPFGVQLKDGKPDPAGEGVLLGEDNYYIDPTP